MTLWVVRAGKYGEREEVALSHERVVAGWQDRRPGIPSSTCRRTSIALSRAVAKEMRGYTPSLRRFCLTP